MRFIQDQRCPMDSISSDSNFLSPIQSSSPNQSHSIAASATSPDSDSSHFMKRLSTISNSLTDLIQSETDSSDINQSLSSHEALPNPLSPNIIPTDAHALIITGASRGLGQALAMSYAHWFFSKNSELNSTIETNTKDTSPKSSHITQKTQDTQDSQGIQATQNIQKILSMVLTARSIEGLCKTAECVTNAAGSRFSRNSEISMESTESGGVRMVILSENKDILSLDLVAGDLSNVDEFADIQSALFSPLSKDLQLLSSYSHICLIHNAGSLHTLKYVATDSNTTPEQTQSYSWLNFGSVVHLTRGFFQYCRQFHKAKYFSVVNISSLAALVPFPSWSYYCSFKAARDMFIKTLATEPAPFSTLRNESVQIDQNNPDVGTSKVATSTNNDSNQFRFLNYAPGMLDTDMQAVLRSGLSDHSEHTEFFKQAQLEKKLHNPIAAAEFLIHLLEVGFESGAHIDFTEQLEKQKSSSSS